MIELSMRKDRCRKWEKEIDKRKKKKKGMSLMTAEENQTQSASISFAYCGFKMAAPSYCRSFGYNKFELKL